MNRVLGSLALLFFTTALFANKYVSYTIFANKKEVVPYEAVYVVFEARQKIHDEVVFFDLEPIKSDAYDIVLIQKKRHEYDYHDAKKKFEYLVFAKKPGKIPVSFRFSIRRATDDAVAQTYVGSRDNVKYIPTVRVDIGTVGVTLDVRELKQKSDAVGSFSLSMRLESNEIDSFGALHVSYIVRGKGWLDENYRPLGEINGVWPFQGVKIDRKRPSSEGFVYEKEFTYAIVAQKDFVLPAATLRVYDLDTKRYKTITTKSVPITVRGIDTKTLLDNEESPKEKTSYFITYFKSAFYCVASFIVGIAIGLSYARLRSRKRNRPVGHCCDTLRKAKTPRELLKHTLALSQSYDLEEEIALLEAMVYEKVQDENFSLIKSKIVEKLDLYDKIRKENSIDKKRHI